MQFGHRVQLLKHISGMYRLWAEMVMGRNGHGPKWLWAEMTSDPCEHYIHFPTFLFTTQIEQK